MYYVHNMESELATGKNYYAANTDKYFASPMKELNQKTILVEDAETNRNDSYRQHTKYNDLSDCYYSTYDLGILLQNEESYLEGTIDSGDDVDYYSFSYQQKNIYSWMGISSEVTIYLESEDNSCNLILYDSCGNQVGMAEDDGNGNKKLTVPDWDGAASQYTIRIERTNGMSVIEDQNYRIRITETKSKDETGQKYYGSYQEQLDRLHDIQYAALPENERYSGTATVEELLDRLKNGEQLDRKEMTYLKIYANLADYEQAEAENYIQNGFYKEIKETAEKEGMELPAGLWEIDMDASGNITVTGQISEEEKKKLEDMLTQHFADGLWEKYLQASNISNEQYRLLDGYHKVEQFIRKATNGRYSSGDIVVDKNGKITGLPDKMCGLINSQDTNARYEELRDDIYMLMDYKYRHGLEGIRSFHVKYQVSGDEYKMKL